MPLEKPLHDLYMCNSLTWFRTDNDLLKNKSYVLLTDHLHTKYKNDFPNGIFDFGSLCREEFSEMFGVAQQKYQKLREELNCEKAFPHVYEKISKLGRS